MRRRGTPVRPLGRVSALAWLVTFVVFQVGVLAGFMIRSAMWSSVGRRDQNSASSAISGSTSGSE